MLAAARLYLAGNDCSTHGSSSATARPSQQSPSLHSSPGVVEPRSYSLVSDLALAGVVCGAYLARDVNAAVDAAALLARVLRPGSTAAEAGTTVAPERRRSPPCWAQLAAQDGTGMRPG